MKTTRSARHGRRDLSNITIDAAAFYFIGLSMHGGKDETCAEPQKHKARQGFSLFYREISFMILTTEHTGRIITIEGANPAKGTARTAPSTDGG